MNRLSVLATMVFSLTTFASVNAAEITVVSAVVMRNALDELVPTFERESGHTITLSYASAGVLRNRIQNGEVVDLTILPKPVLSELVASRKIVAGSTVDVALSTVGIAVRAGAPKPDISSVDAFKRSLLAARTIVYTDPAGGGASGVHFARVLERLGIADQIKPRTKLTSIPGPGPGEIVARGDADIAVSQTMDLLGASGADFVGPLPRELQNETDFTYAVGVGSNSKEPSATTAFITFLSSPVAASVLKAKGMEPVNAAVK